MLPLGFILAVCWVPGWTGGAIPTGWVVLSATLPFLLKPIRFNQSCFWGLCFLAYTALSLLWTIEPKLGLGWLWQYLILAMAFWYGSQEENLEPLFTGLGFGLLVSLVILTFQWGGWEQVPSIGLPAGLFFNHTT